MSRDTQLQFSFVEFVMSINFFLLSVLIWFSWHRCHRRRIGSINHFFFWCNYRKLLTSSNRRMNVTFSLLLLILLLLIEIKWSHDPNEVSTYLEWNATKGDRFILWRICSIFERVKISLKNPIEMRHLVLSYLLQVQSEQPTTKKMPVLRRAITLYEFFNRAHYKCGSVTLVRNTRWNCAELFQERTKLCDLLLHLASTQVLDRASALLDIFLRVPQKLGPIVGNPLEHTQVVNNYQTIIHFFFFFFRGVFIALADHIL